MVNYEIVVYVCVSVLMLCGGYYVLFVVNVLMMYWEYKRREARMLWIDVMEIFVCVDSERKIWMWKLVFLGVVEFIVVYRVMYSVVYVLLIKAGREAAAKILRDVAYLFMYYMFWWLCVWFYICDYVVLSIGLGVVLWLCGLCF